MTVRRRNVGALFAPPAYSHVAVASGELVLTAGAVPLDADGRLVGEGDLATQTRQVIENLLAALAEGGASPTDVAKTTVYVVSSKGDDLSAVWEVVRASQLADAPSTLLGVSALGYGGQLVEIEATAVV